MEIERNVVRGPVEGGGEGVSVRLRCAYPAPPAEVWDAIAEPDRLKQWFLPVSGELREGGSFQLEGNAGGEILRCAGPRVLRVSYGGPESVVEVVLAPGDAGGTGLTLTHTVPIGIAQNGAGALFVAPGWDSAVTALGLHLAGASTDAAATEEFTAASVRAWSAAVEDSGTATADELAAVTGMLGM